MTSTCWPRPVSSRWWSADKDADRPVQSGHHVEHRDAGPERRTVGIAGEAHQPGHGLHDQVVAGQPRALGGAEPADREVHQARVDGRRGVVVEAELGERAGLEVLDRDVRPAQQLLGLRPVLVDTEVEHDRALVAVDRQVVGRDAVLLRRDPRPRVVAGGSFHLDHGGPEVGEQHRAVRPGEDARQVGDEQAVERAAVAGTLWFICPPRVTDAPREDARMAPRNDFVEALARGWPSSRRSRRRPRRCRSATPRRGRASPGRRPGAC